MKEFSIESGVPVKILKEFIKKEVISYNLNTDSDLSIVIALHKIINDMELLRVLCMHIRKSRRQSLFEYPMSKTEKYILQEYLSTDATIHVKEMQTQVWDELHINASLDYIKRIGHRATKIRTGRTEWPAGILNPEELKERREERQRIKSRNKRLEESERIIL